jgi:hypothetical protein
MRKALITTALALALIVPAEASARSDYVWCRKESNWAQLVVKFQPRGCILGGQYHYQQFPLKNIRWRSWGGASAYGTGTFYYNMGFRARTRFKVYRARHFEFDAWTYTRASGVTYTPTGPVRWRKKLL